MFENSEPPNLWGSTPKFGCSSSHGLPVMIPQNRQVAIEHNISFDVSNSLDLSNKFKNDAVKIGIDLSRENVAEVRQPYREATPEFRLSGGNSRPCMHDRQELTCTPWGAQSPNFDLHVEFLVQICSK